MFRFLMTRPLEASARLHTTATTNAYISQRALQVSGKARRLFDFCMTGVSSSSLE